MCKEIDGMPDFWDLVLFEPGELSVSEAVLRLKQAEFLADESYEWALIGSSWFQVWGESGFSNALRCAWQSMVNIDFICGTASSVNLWLHIMEREPKEIYLNNALQLMADMENVLQEYRCIYDICDVARMWLKFPDYSGGDRARSLLAEAELLYSKIESGEIDIRNDRLQEYLEGCHKQIDRTQKALDGFERTVKSKIIDDRKE
jgi:hypothetical protein